MTDHQSPLSMYSDPGAPEIIPGEEARSRFYEAYRRQSNRFDKELKEYNKELNITLLFVRLVTFTARSVSSEVLTEIEITYFQSALFAVVASTFLRLEQNTHLLLSWDNPQGMSRLYTLFDCVTV